MEHPLLHRARYCPIGTQGVVRMLSTTFTRLCLHHQSRAKGKEFVGRDPVASIYAIACSACEIAPYIVNGVDPALVVGDVQWVTNDELSALQDKLQHVIKEVNTKALRTVSTNKRYNMKKALLEVKELLKRMDILISGVLTTISSDTDKAHDNAQDTCTSHAAQLSVTGSSVPPSKEEMPKSHYIATKHVESEVKKETPVLSAKSLILAQKLYQLEQEGKSRQYMSETYNKSKKYIGVLIRKYKMTLNQ